jgi:hypothetical protein
MLSRAEICPEVVQMDSSLLETLVLISLQFSETSNAIPRCKPGEHHCISPGLDNLDKLKASGRSFLPDRSQVRPHPDELQRKALQRKELDRKWNTIEDFFLATRFGALANDDATVAKQCPTLQSQKIQPHQNHVVLLC